jgi:phosphatidate cytidylyltransferase
MAILKNRNLIQRSVTGLLFVATVTGALIWNAYSFAILFFFITILSLYEFYTAIEKYTNIAPQKYYGVFVAGIWFMLTFFAVLGLFDFKYLLVIIPLLLLISINQLFTITKRPVHDITYTLFGIFYTASFSLLNFLVFPGNFLIGEHGYSYKIVLGILVLIWTNDTMAYVTGSLIGKNKLFPRISPKKTWEGTVGGVIFTLWAAWIYGLNIDILFLEDWIVIAFITGIFGTLGDLTESLVKRALGIKDSGNILPGHGGLLDRFDSLLAVTPLVFTYLYLKY